METQVSIRRVGQGDGGGGFEGFKESGRGPELKRDLPKPYDLELELFRPASDCRKIKGHIKFFTRSFRCVDVIAKLLSVICVRVLAHHFSTMARGRSERGLHE